MSANQQITASIGKNPIVIGEALFTTTGTTMSDATSQSTVVNQLDPVVVQPAFPPIVP